MKICTSCKKEKEFSDFHKRTASRDGFALVCKTCLVAFKKQYYSIPKNLEKDKERQRIWRQNNLEKKRNANKEWVANNLTRNREYQKVWARKYRETHKRDQSLDKDRKRQWALANPEKVRISARKANAKARSTTKGKLNGAIAAGVGYSLRHGGGNKKGRKWEQLVGYTVIHLKSHLEKQFSSGMNWENYGRYWQIDHIIPISAFNFQSPEDIDFRKCWSLSNLRPLQSRENQSKNDKLIKPFQPSLCITDHIAERTNLLYYEPCMMAE